MPDPWRVATAAAGAAVIAFVLAAVGTRFARRDKALCGVALLAGAVWGAIAGLAWAGALPRVPPSSALDRLLLVVLPAALAIELEVAGGWLDGAWLSAERAIVSLVATPVLLHGSVWLDGRAGVWPAILAAALFLWAAWEGIEGQVAATGDGIVPAVTAAALVAAGAAIVAGGWFKGGVVALLLGAALGGALASARLRAAGFAAGGTAALAPAAGGTAALAGAGLVALFGAAVAGCCFGRLPLLSAVFLLLAPLAASIPAGIAWFLPESGTQRLLASARYRWALALVPLVAVMAAAKADGDRLLSGMSARQSGPGSSSVRQLQPSSSPAEASTSPEAP